MAPRRRSRLNKVASASEAVDYDRKGKLARASEGFEILRLKKEVFEATAAKARLRAWPKPAEKEAQTAGAKKKKMKVVKKRLPKGQIDFMRKRLYTIEDIPEDELMAKYDQEFRDIYAAHKLVAEKMRAYQRALIAQYDALGYAEDETEVTDDEDKN